MANLNKVMLIGRLTRDPEMRHTPSGQAIAEFGLAVNRFWSGKDGTRQEDTAFIEITCWARQAELAQQYLSKGRQVFVEGHLKFDQWTSQDGQKRSKLTVTAETLQFLDGGRSEGGGGPGGPGGPGGAAGGSGYGGQGSGRSQRQPPPPASGPHDDGMSDRPPSGEEIPF